MLPETPFIITYRSETAPLHETWLAFFRGYKANFPICFRASTEMAVRDKAAAWWEAETKKAADSKARLNKAHAARRKEPVP